MKFNYLLLGLLFIFQMVSCQTKEKNRNVHVENNDRYTHDMVSETRNVGTFHSIKSSTSIALKLYQSNQSEVIVYASDNYGTKPVETKVSNGILEVSLENGSYKNYDVRVEVYMPELKSIELSSASSLKMQTPFKVKDIQIECDSGSSLKGELTDGNDIVIDMDSGSSAKLEVNGKNLHVTTESGSSLVLMGKGEEGYFKAESGSSINANKLALEYAKAEAESGSSINVNAGTLDKQSDISSSVN